MSLKNYLEQLFENEAIVASTLKSRIGFLLSAAKVVKGEWNDLSFLNNTKAVSKRVEDSENPSTKFNRYAYIVSAIDSLKESPLTKKSEMYYRKQLVFYENLKKERQNDNRMTQKQIDNFDELENLQDILTSKFDELFKDYEIKGSKVSNADIERLSPIGRNGKNLYRFAQKYQELMILACYVFQPALRDNYSHMKFATSKTKTKDHSFNYFRYNRSWSECTIHMNIYKNLKVMGEDVQLGVMPPLINVMKNWFHFLKLILGQDPQYVFLYDINMTAKTITWTDSKHGLTQRIKRASLSVFERDLSINSYRHIWEGYYHSHPDYAKMTIKDSEKLHEMLLHNYNTAKRYNLIKDHPLGPKK